MNKIILFEIEEWEKEQLKNIFTDAQVFFTKSKVQHETDIEVFTAEVISTFIYSTLTRDALTKFPNLKLIATRSTGYDHIDLVYCQEKGITVVNVPSYGAASVAEQTYALILAISRKLIQTVERSRRRNFDLEGLQGFDLEGKTLGVIGAGKIGKKVVDLGLCFGMNVLVHTKTPGEEKENLRYVALDELLSSSDVVTLHVPYSKETHHIINRDNIKKFKKGSILINTARGSLIETQAILEGLETGILQGAGLDVLEEECFLKEERELLTDDFLKSCDIKTQLLNHVLLQRDDVLFTSHNAFNTKEALSQILETTVANIKAYAENNVQNIVKIS
ncbi:MAG TPA: NAD(P)-dependent oxidoreductase [Methylomirabilota bacterium]|nr:NAD(P)-dependent oxidoreductase [Methylomirabilota bacterium]